MIRILTDSTCDLLPAEAARLGVEVVHMQVRFEDGEVFRDGLDIGIPGRAGHHPGRVL